MILTQQNDIIPATSSAGFARGCPVARDWRRKKQKLKPEILI